MRRPVIQIVLLVALGAPLVHATEWPGWRADGSGVSSERDLPVKWGAQENIRWRTRIDGDGISSPIVWGDRVFVTAAVETTESTTTRTSVLAAALALLALAAVSGIFAMKGRGANAVDEGLLTRALVRWLDRLVVILSAAGFVVGSAILLTRPEALFQPGELGPAWLWSGLFCALGLFAAVGLLAPASSLRLIGSLVFVVVAWFLYVELPLNNYNYPFHTWKIFIAPALLLGGVAWHVALFATARRAQRPFKSPGQALPGLLGAGALTALAVLVFLHVNSLTPHGGLARSIVCLDRNSGEILWKSVGFVEEGQKKHPVNSYATPTPVSDGTHVVAHFGSGVFCVDFDGTVLWRRLEPNFSRNLRYGAASSPIMHGERVIIAFMAESGGAIFEGSDLSYAEHSYVAAIDLKTGEVVWKMRPPGSHDAYNTPVLAPTDGGEPVMLLATWRHLVAIDPANGEELWSLPIPINQPVPTIAVDESTMYVAGGTHSPKAMVAVSRPTDGDQQRDASIRWTLTRSVPESSSPVLYEGLLFWVTDNGIASCVDPVGGELVWKERLGGRHLASPVAADGKIYFVAAGGDTTVIRAGREFEVLAVNSINETSYASPAISGGQIFLRSASHVFCIGDRRG